MPSSLHDTDAAAFVARGREDRMRVQDRARAAGGNNVFFHPNPIDRRPVVRVDWRPVPPSRPAPGRTIRDSRDRAFPSQGRTAGRDAVNGRGASIGGDRRQPQPRY